MNPKKNTKIPLFSHTVLGVLLVVSATQFCEASPNSLSKNEILEIISNSAGVKKRASKSKSKRYKKSKKYAQYKSKKKRKTYTQRDKNNEVEMPQGVIPDQPQFDESPKEPTMELKYTMLPVNALRSRNEALRRRFEGTDNDIFMPPQVDVKKEKPSNKVSFTKGVGYDAGSITPMNQNPKATEKQLTLNTPPKTPKKVKESYYNMYY